MDEEASMCVQIDSDAKSATAAMVEQVAERLVVSLTGMMHEFSILDHQDVALHEQTPPVIRELIRRANTWISRCNGVGRCGWTRFRNEAESRFSADAGGYSPKTSPAYVPFLAEKFRSLVVESEMYADAREHRQELAAADGMIAEAALANAQQTAAVSVKRKPVVTDNVSAGDSSSKANRVFVSPVRRKKKKDAKVTESA